ncbi:cysteine desulfurase-like protein [Longimicrobium terrae]|uniref:Cysteine desulfurase family protein (TIGR01976 family) n=1 Tax=Longimicrobium terrae TaxID=1639882 RepID=A0A841GQG2_9BACT|nr:cysteine desulfurase-like protein [Longimicrobium terrae]MBB4634885.1 cysteine desulfurase family protein (TIGR01976 family) [Longimicrobium terrae]MBB6069280.1 cysteine desulfurase family protein (TIGR01976 family) [Longimicrobium terrae]NNC31911.1 cysteine desulfurase-like protein [Longimicrobium terrae]
MSDSFAARVRADFPVFERRVGGRPIAFFDGPGGSQVPRQVGDAVRDYLLMHNANTHGFFATSEETDAVITRAREAMAAFVNAGSPREIVFGQNMTTLTFALSRALGRGWGEGDEIIVSQLDHQANVAPWRLLAEDRGMTVHVLPFSERTYTLDYDALAGLLSPRTRLVAVGAASNAIGTVNDVARVCAAARDAGALSFVDAVHYAPHRLPDVQAIGCDFLACSAYKFFGPHMGILWGRGEHLEGLTPYKVPPASNAAPDRWETGTSNHEGMAGTAAAVEWIASLAPSAGADLRASLEAAYAAIEEHETARFARLYAGLSAIPGVHIHGPAADGMRTPTAGFVIDGVSPDQAARTLGQQGVFVWNGDFYATTVCDVLGLSDCGGLIRAGVAPYTTDEDVDRLVEGVRALAAS